jgi:hypothetical protein
MAWELLGASSTALAPEPEEGSAEREASQLDVAARVASSLWKDKPAWSNYAGCNQMWSHLTSLCPNWCCQVAALSLHISMVHLATIPQLREQGAK